MSALACAPAAVGNEEYCFLLDGFWSVFSTFMSDCCKKKLEECRQKKKEKAAAKAAAKVAEAAKRGKSPFCCFFARKIPDEAPSTINSPALLRSESSLLLVDDAAFLDGDASASSTPREFFEPLCLESRGGADSPYAQHVANAAANIDVDDDAPSPNGASQGVGASDAPTNEAVVPLPTGDCNSNTEASPNIVDVACVIHRCAVESASLMVERHDALQAPPPVDRLAATLLAPNQMLPPMRDEGPPPPPSLDEQALSAHTAVDSTVVPPRSASARTEDSTEAASSASDSSHYVGMHSTTSTQPDTSRDRSSRSSFAAFLPPAPPLLFDAVLPVVRALETGDLSSASSSSIAVPPPLRYAHDPYAWNPFSPPPSLPGEQIPSVNDVHVAAEGSDVLATVSMRAPPSVMCCYHKQGKVCKMGEDCWYGHEGDHTTPCHYGASCKAGHRHLSLPRVTSGGLMAERPKPVSKREAAVLSAAFPSGHCGYQTVPSVAMAAAAAPAAAAAAAAILATRVQTQGTIRCPHCGTTDNVSAETFPIFKGKKKTKATRGHCAVCLVTFLVS